MGDSHRNRLTRRLRESRKTNACHLSLLFAGKEMTPRSPPIPGNSQGPVLLQLLLPQNRPCHHTQASVITSHWQERSSVSLPRAFGQMGRWSPLGEAWSELMCCSGQTVLHSALQGPSLSTCSGPHLCLLCSQCKPPGILQTFTKCCRVKAVHRKFEKARTKCD